ncbi:4-hydroxy-2-oxovalerate aldolase [Propionicimonas sp. T2.31MG-18]|uniref:4-hydroxy-2-oxovalerate aldolase n=1 Tax=Propionicimonas sp. T2.31MG-18 TaxID=3157620 RepID=UPI0035EC8A43
MTAHLFISDVTLRDGSHVVAHRFTVAAVRRIAAALDRAGVDGIEVGHGDGLGQPSVRNGSPLHSDLELIEAAADVAERSQIAVLIQPRLGTTRHLADACHAGATLARVATHCTDAASAAAHLAAARDLGFDTAGFLMMAALATPTELAAQARLMEGYGAQCVYLADSSGALTTVEIAERVSALRDALDDSTQIGIHAHHNLSLGVANSVAAVAAGAHRVDASLAGMGAGAGNAQIEAFVAVADRMGLPHHVDLAALIDAADDLVRPLLPAPVQVNRDTLTLGYAGVYGTFLAPAREAAARFGVRPFDILVEAGRRHLIAGQEGAITGIAKALRRAYGHPQDSPKDYR